MHGGGSPDRLIRASDLKRQRGWTEGLVVTLLGAPDALSPNPHGWRAPMRWYREDRVVDAEGSEPFARWARQLPEDRSWRRGLPTRAWAPDEVEQLEWLDDPSRIALFHAPRRPRTRLRRRRRDDDAAATAAVAPAAEARTPMYALGRFEVLRLF